MAQSPNQQRAALQQIADRLGVSVASLQSQMRRDGVDDKTLDYITRYVQALEAEQRLQAMRRLFRRKN